MEAVKIIEERFQVTLPDDLKTFWTKPYKKTFWLYNWWYEYTILNPYQVAEEVIDLPREKTGADILVDLKQENIITEEVYNERSMICEYDLVSCTHLLNSIYPPQPEFARQIYTLVPVARDHHNMIFFLACGFNKEGEYLGLFLWMYNQDFEFPVFIADSIIDLVIDGVIKVDCHDIVPFDKKKYLQAALDGPANGYITPLKYKTWIDRGEEVNLSYYKTLFDFYRSSFGGKIEFEPTGDLIIVTITYNYQTDRMVFAVVGENLISSIEKLNAILNSYDTDPNFGRPKYYGYYIVDEKYVARLRTDLVNDLVQKGYIMPRWKLFPMSIYYNPRTIPKFLWTFNFDKKYGRLEGKKLQWILPEQ